MSNISNNINTPRTTPAIQNTAQDVPQANSSFSRDNQQGFQFDFIIMMIVIQLIMQWIESMNNGGGNGGGGNQPEPLKASDTFRLAPNDFGKIAEYFNTPPNTGISIKDTNNDNVLSAGDQITFYQSATGAPIVHTLTQQDIDALNISPGLGIVLNEDQRNKALDLRDAQSAAAGAGVGHVTDTNNDGVLSVGDEIFFLYPNDAGYTRTLSEEDIKHILS